MLFHGASTKSRTGPPSAVLRQTTSSCCSYRTGFQPRMHSSDQRASRFAACSQGLSAMDPALDARHAHATSWQSLWPNPKGAVRAHNLPVPSRLVSGTAVLLHPARQRNKKIGDARLLSLGSLYQLQQAALADHEASHGLAFLLGGIPYIRSIQNRRYAALARQR